MYKRQLRENDRRRTGLFHGLLFSLPGSPVMYYGAEIGMGDNIYLGDRDGVRTPMQWTADRNAGVEMHNASLAVMAFTLQFIRPLHRDRLVADIYEGLNPNGGRILLEKVLGEDSTFNRLFIKYYYDLKRRNGYSELEITQKREALENVLIPYKLLENREMLLRAGFRHVDVFFKWYNFCGIVALK